MQATGQPSDMASRIGMPKPSAFDAEVRRVHALLARKRAPRDGDEPSTEPIALQPREGAHGGQEVLVALARTDVQEVGLAAEGVRGRWLR